MNLNELLSLELIMVRVFVCFQAIQSRRDNCCKNLNTKRHLKAAPSKEGWQEVKSYHFF